jgi:hypothetical protein
MEQFFEEAKAVEAGDPKTLMGAFSEHKSRDFGPKFGLRPYGLVDIAYSAELTLLFSIV